MMRLSIVLAWVGLLAAQNTRLVDQAWQLAANGQRDKAVELLRRVLKENPRDADARLLLGSLLMEAGNRSESIAQLSEGVRLRPQSAEAQNALGEAYNNFGEFKAALVPLEHAIALKPDFGVAQLNLGDALLETGELDASANHLDRATKLLGKSDDGAQAHYLRAKVYTAQNETEKAAQELQLAVAIQPAFPEAWSDLGEARKVLLDDAGALKAFERAVALNPNDFVAQYRLGAEYLDRDEPPNAIDHLERAYQLKNDDQSTLNALQRALRKAGRSAEADAIKQQLAQLLLKRDQANQNAVAAAALNNDGTKLQKAGDLSGAAKKYSAAVQLAPQNVAIRVNYAVALLRLGQWTDGLNELHAALLMDPANGPIQETLKQALAQAPPETVPSWYQR